MTRRLKLISWNVNGLNAALKKGFVDSVRALDADIVALQETKLQALKLTPQMEAIDDYQSHWSFSTVKKGYSGTAVYTRLTPASVDTGIGISRYDGEGRIIRVDYDDFLFYNVYFPNGQMSDERLRYKLDFYRDFFDRLAPEKAAGRRIIVCGDYNTAHNEIDLKNPKANAKTSGFLRIERDWLDAIVAQGYVDTFRHFYPDTVKYSWWSYRFNARSRNAGWRIDYFFVTRNMIADGRVTDAFINNHILGSDHCPVGIELEI